MVEAAKVNVFYGIDIELHNVGVDIRVNDIPVYFDYSGGQLTVEVPSPEAIINGENTLSVHIFLPYKKIEYEEGACVSATLFMQEINGVNSSKVKLSNVTLKLSNDSVIENIEDFLGGNKGSEIRTLDESKAAVGSVTTTLESPFPRWAWQSGKAISDSKETYESLLEAYQIIHSRLKNKDLTKLQELYKERSSEIAIAYHLDGEAAGHEKLNVGGDMNDKDLQLIDVVTQNMSLKVIGNGKLAQISNALNGQPILYFQNSPRLYHLYKFLFYLNDKNEWIMIR